MTEARGGPGFAILLTVLVGAALAWLLVAKFAPGGSAALAVGLGVFSALIAGLGAGNIGEALAILITLGLVVGLGVFWSGLPFTELPVVRTVALALYAGVSSGQMIMGVYNEFHPSVPSGS